VQEARPVTALPKADFWSVNQPGFRFTSAEPGTPEFFRDVERHRYRLEPHIPEIAEFARWAGKDVLEAGCGIGTDAVSFVRADARYTGLDGSATAIDLARARFELEGMDGTFEQGSITQLPFDDASFDLVYSHGVVHHIPDTARAIAEFHRVLRPGGTALVMVYHRDSLNYRFTIMVLRRALATALLLPGAVTAVSRLTGELPAVLEAQRKLIREHGRRYLTDSQLFLSNNTDGPGNPLSKVYSRAEAAALFGAFARAETEVRFLNLRIYPGGQALAATRTARKLERRIGWHLYVRATKS
jgi:ubiquinone/menaquinone biosynthesis C-methylase UbiE